MIPVTRTFLPPQEEYQTILARAWNAGWITNRGVLVKELEERLLDYLQVPFLVPTTNGTLPLQLAIKALGLKGEIITTPFSYVATTSSIVWENCIPVFVDIHPDYFTIEERNIEAAITEKTTAILATHVYGNPCNVEAIEKIATKHQLKVIYDAAHCFGVEYKGKSIFKYGDVSTCSFHATKLFHTGEGGALFTTDKKIKDIMHYHHNFGHKGQEDFFGLGINAKMSEMQAAMGLAVLPYLGEIYRSRREIVNFYSEELTNTDLQFLKIRKGTVWNYGYFPVFLKDERTTLNVKTVLEKNNIFPRRYFYPSLNRLPYVSRHSCPVSEAAAERALCLPIYFGLKREDLVQITTLIKSNT